MVLTLLERLCLSKETDARGMCQKVTRRADDAHYNRTMYSIQISKKNK